MAMDAKQAAEKIKNGNFDDVDELYNALNGKKEYGAEFAALLKHIEAKVKIDISLYAGLATAAQSVEELSAVNNPLDEKDPVYATAREKLSKVELTYTVEENGKPVTKVVEGEQRNKMVAQLVAAAKLATKDALRGASSPENPAAKQFRNATDENARKAIYQQTLNDQIDMAILQSLLVTETTKINQEMQQKYGKDEKKANEEAKILLSAREKEIRQKIVDLGHGVLDKISLGVDGAAAYCANVKVNAENHLAEYKANVKKIAMRINQGFAKLKDQGKEQRGQWQKFRANANKVYDACNQKMSDGIVAFHEGCKHVWENRYEIAHATIQAINKNKYEIGADMLAAAGFAATVASGGTAAVVGGAAYAAYTIGRRVFYEAYKQKRENPKKTYKQIYTNSKFLTKAAFACGAAAISWGIADTAASAGADIATEAAAEVAKKLAAERMLKRGVTMIGSLTSNLVGVATAKDDEERRKEWRSLGISAVTAGVTIFVAEACSGHGEVDANDHEQDLGGNDDDQNLTGDGDQNPVEGNDDDQNLTGDGDQNPVEGNDDDQNLTGDGDQNQDENDDQNLTGDGDQNQDENDDQNPTGDGDQNQDDDKQPEHVDEGITELKDFPEQWNDKMGISKRQFEILKGWYDKLDTTDGEGMSRFYSHAEHYAAQLSIDSENPMTAEQVLFKFSRLAAITSVKSGEYGTIGTGSLGQQMENIYHLLGCGDKLNAEQMEEARKTLDICTLNEAGRQDGRMDAQKFFAVAGAGYRGLPVDEDGTLKMTRRIRVIGEGTNCPGDKRVMYEEVKGGEERVVTKPVEKTEQVVTKVVTEENTGSDTRLELERKGNEGGDAVLTRAVPTQDPVTDEDDQVIIGATSQTGDRPGLEGARTAQNLRQGSAETQISGRKQKLGAGMLKELQDKGLVK